MQSNNFLSLSVNADSKLTDDLKKGDEMAFEEVYRLYHRHLYYIAVRYLKDPALAEDALQEVFLKLWSHRQTLDGQQSLKAFLSVMMRNHVLNTIRDKQREILHHIEYTAEWSETDAENVQEEEWQTYEQLVAEGVSHLSPQKKRVFQLKTQGGLNNEQIAHQLGLSINTVKYQFSQSLHFLRGYVRRHSVGLLLALLSYF
jgi:RNA polymerase sigma-70 factor (family 1)